MSSIFYFVYALEGTFSVRYSWNLVRMFALMKSRMTLKLGHVGSKSRSLDQILEKPCVSFDETMDEIENVSCGVKKTRSLGQILEKGCVHSRGLIFGLILMKLGQNVCIDEISDDFKIRSCGIIKKNRSLGQILEKPCVSSWGPIFGLILIKLDQNVCLNEISDEKKNRSCWIKNKVTLSNLKKILCML